MSDIKKAAGAEETKDGARAQTADGSRRGGRGGRGRGGKKPEDDRDKRRPETARAGKQDAKDGEEGQKRDNKGPRGGNNKRQIQQDVNSWKYKFHNREQVKYEKIKFTAETEIPALPAKEARLKNPTKEEFDRNMKKLDDEINKIREKRKALQQKRSDIQAGGKMTGSQLTYRDALTAKIKENQAFKQNLSKFSS